MNPHKIVSAQVVLAAASGARPGPKARITSRKISDFWKPSIQSIFRISDVLRDMGFEVGECVGNSFSITGAVRLFESCFRTRLRETEERIQFADGGDELANANIPLTLRPEVVAIAFTPPPKFGPGSDARFF